MSNATRDADWLARGADYDELPLGSLAADLARLKQGAPPVGSERTRPLILFDTLVGRAHAATAPLIDRLVWIDIPLDIALARKIGAMELHIDTFQVTGVL